MLIVVVEVWCGGTLWQNLFWPSQVSASMSAVRANTDATTAILAVGKESG